MTLEFLAFSEVQAAAQTSATAEAQPCEQNAPGAIPTDSPAAPRFVAAACQVNSGHAPFAVLDCADCHHVVPGSSSRTLAEAESIAALLNQWDEDERVAWPLEKS